MRSFPANGPLVTVAASMKGWSSFWRCANCVIVVAPEKSLVLRMSKLMNAMLLPVPQSTPPYNVPPCVAKRRVWSRTGVAPMRSLSAHVRPPSLEKNTGDLPLPRLGLGVNAVAAISSGFSGLTARLASLSPLVSPLDRLGMMLTTVMMSDILAALELAAEHPFDFAAPLVRQEVERISRLIRRPRHALRHLVLLEAEEQEDAADPGVQLWRAEPDAVVTAGVQHLDIVALFASFQHDGNCDARQRP